MGTFIIANSDIQVGRDIKSYLQTQFAYQRFIYHTSASEVFEQYQDEALFMPKEELKINCIIFDSFLFPMPYINEPSITCEYLAGELRDRGYSGILAHYGTRDMSFKSRELVNISSLRTVMPLPDFANRIAHAFRQPQERVTQSASGITLRLL